MTSCVANLNKESNRPFCCKFHHRLHYKLSFQTAFWAANDENPFEITKPFNLTKFSHWKLSVFVGLQHITRLVDWAFGNTIENVTIPIPDD